MKDDFTVLLQNRTEFENNNPAGVFLSLPATKDELMEAMRALNITDKNPQDFFINGYSTAGGRNVEIPFEWVREGDIDKLNFLAARLEEMTPMQLDKINAIMQKDFRFESLDKLIDYTYNTDYFVFIPDVYTYSDLGDYYLNESGMVQMPEEWKSGIDKEAFGFNAAQHEDGTLTDHGYVLKSGDEWVEHFTGREIPEQYRIMGYPEATEKTDPERTEKDAAPAAIPQEAPPLSASIHPLELTATKPAERMKEITDRLEKGIEELFESDRFKNYLNVMSKFHNYSFNNTLLIAMQQPDATYVAGYNSWKNTFGRQVVKGGKSIKVIAPSPFKIKREEEQIDPQTKKPITDKDGNPVTKEVEVTIPAFKVVPVFDISQTEGKELPTIGVSELTGDVEQYRDFFRAVEQASPVPVAFENIAGTAHGYYHLEEKRIAIDEGMSELQNLKTLIHEIAHAKLHDIDLNTPKEKQADRPDRRTREVQAESVAYAVCQHYGLDTSDYSFAYVATWSSGRELSELKASLETIRSAASELITEIDKNFAEITRDKEQQKENTPGLDEKEIEPDTFTIYQLQDNAPDDYGFRPLSEIREKGLSIDPAYYEEVYTAPLEKGMDLEDIFEKFNIDRPEDFKGHSLSVSDVVVLHQNGQDTAHYVDSFGYEDISQEFLYEREAAFHLDNEKYLYIQEAENGIDYTLYDSTFSEIDGGQIDNPALTMTAACKEILALHELTPQQTDRIPIAEYERLPELIQGQPTVTINFSEHDAFTEGQTLDFATADRLIDRLDSEVNRERVNPEQGRYYKTDFTIESVQNGRIHSYNGRQDLGDGDGTLTAHIEKHAAFYRNDPDYQKQLQSRSPEAAERANAGYDYTLQEYVPYLKLHRNLSDIEVNADTALEALAPFAGSTPDFDGRIAYYQDLKTYVSECRLALNTSPAAELPPAPELSAYIPSTEEYISHVEDEIQREARAAGMTVEEYAANGYEPYGQEATKENPLAAAEMSTEQNYNMIDGQINNAPTPTVDEIEKRANAGEQISLSELAAAIEKDREAGKQKEETQKDTAEKQEEETHVHYYAIDENAARRAKEMNSYSDYIPGSATAEYKRCVDEAAEIARRQKKRVDPQYHDKIDSLLDTYARRLAENMNRRNSIDARVPSILITGGGNFPVRKKEKQNAARDKNMSEWEDIQGLLDKIRSTGMGGISADDPQAIPKLESKLEKLEKAQETMKAVNAYYRKHKTLDGCPHISPERIEQLKTDMAHSFHIEDKPYPTWALSNNNAEIHRIKGRIAELTRREENAYTGWEFDGGRVEANRQDNRLQIYFDEKPDESTREDLKQNGFRWSPKAGAWQRQLNDNAIYAADRLSCIRPISGERPVEIQKKARAAKQEAKEEKPSIRQQLKEDKETVKAAPKKAAEKQKKNNLERS